MCVCVCVLSPPTHTNHLMIIRGRYVYYINTIYYIKRVRLQISVNVCTRAYDEVRIACDYIQI